MPIFDQGYQHWQGTLSGHGWRWLAVTRHGVRALLKNWIVRLLLLVAWMPAIALVAALTTWGLLEQQAESVLRFLQRTALPSEILSQPQNFRSAAWTIAYSYFFKAELICSLFLVLVVGPNLVSRDLRFNAFPLYFSRPLRRIDYFLGKLGVIGFFLAATSIVPAAGAYLLGVAFSLDLAVVRDTHHLLWAGLLYGLIVTLSAGTLMLALSSLSRRSIYVGLAWAGFVFLGSMISSAMIGIRGDIERRERMQDHLTTWVRDNPPPEGIEMSRGYPVFRGDQRWMRGNRPGESDLTPEEKRKERWYRAYGTAQSQMWAEAEAARYAQGATDWRPLLSYAANLDRMADWLFDTDTAWVTFGHSFETSRSMIAIAKGPKAAVSTGPINARALADSNAWQFPWYWSAATLSGLWLVSVIVLSRRVKSMDRLR
jgi:ABC-type transport system involved in multi-copper enzyme maturation permease subunit